MASRHLRRIVRGCFLLGILALPWAASSLAQDDAAAGAASEQIDAGLINGGVEQLQDSGKPALWLFPPTLEQAGYKLTTDANQKLAGERSVVLDSTNAQIGPNAFGNLMQPIDAVSVRGKTVRFRAAVRTDDLAADAKAQLWFRVDRKGPLGQPIVVAFDNMDARPIREQEWKHYDIVLRVPDDADNMYVGLIFLGKGRAWFDDATLTVVPDDTATTSTPAMMSPTPRKPGGRAAAPANDPPQPFWTPWLLLVPVGVALLALSQFATGWWRGLGLRFAIVYWLLYSMPQSLYALIPVGYFMGQGYNWVMDKTVRWTSRELLGIQRDLVATNGSGDTTFDYIRVLVIFALSVTVAVCVSVAWPPVARKLAKESWLSQAGLIARDLLRSFLRYAIAMIMIGYGLAKVGDAMNQFPAPGVDQLLKPYGDGSPMNLVWTFMGASRAYTVFAGLGEVAAALLLIWRRTATLGALVTIGVMTNVMLLNYCYDVPVKLYSSHIVLMAVFLLFPDARRLLGMFVTNRDAPAADLRPPYAPGMWIVTQRAIKGILVAITVGIPIVNYGAMEWSAVSNRAPQPAILGSYQVEEFSKNGTPVPPLLDDATRWGHLTLVRYPSFGGMPARNDMLLVYTLDRTPLATQVVIAEDEKTISPQQGGGSFLPAEINVEIVDDDHVTFTGEVNNEKLVVKTRRLRREDFLLVNRGFHWINEYPYNR